MAEHFEIVYSVRDVKTGKMVCEACTYDLPLSDGEMAIPGFVKMKMKVAAQGFARELRRIFNRYIA